MPKKSKQSKTSKKSKPSKRSFGEWCLRYIPYDVLAFLILAMLSLHIRFWPLEFVASYIPHIIIILWAYVVVYLTIVTYFAFIYDFSAVFKKVGRVGVISFGLSILLGVYIMALSINIVTPQANITDQLTHDKDHFTIGTFNKLYTSRNFSDDANLITATKLDVFSVQEAHEMDVELLKKRVNHEYSYVTDCDCSADDTEVGIISRYPIVNALTIYEHENAVIARTQISSEEHGDFVVYVVHMHIPYLPSAYNLRDNAYIKLSEAISQETLPTFAIGDFNTTIYAPDMQNFMKDTPNIQNVVARSWPQCSWFGTPFGELACARIDYVFAPVEATTYSLEIGNQDYSDHRSVTAELEF